MKRLLLGLALLALAGPALAQQGPTYPTAVGNTGAGGAVQLDVNSQGIAVPRGLSDNTANVIPGRRAATPGDRAQVVTLSPNSGAPRQYPADAIPITCNAAGTTGAVVGTCAAAQGKTTYLCSFDVQAIGGTAVVGPITVANLVGSSMVYQGSSSAAGGTVVARTFTPCVPASAVNTAITITTTADGTATAVNVNAHGFQQ